MNSGVVLGARVKDKITGFEGVVTGICHYITGCDQVLVQPKLKKGGDFVEARWIDIMRAAPQGGALLVLDEARNTGPDKPAPIK